jgi:Ni,Fe-hydrogenase III large subunit/Ni,Fe-hydrogenase III component G
MEPNLIISTYLPNAKHSSHNGNVVFVEVDQIHIKDSLRALYREAKLPLKSVFAEHSPDLSDKFAIYYVFAVPEKNTYIVPFVYASDTESFVSVADEMHEFSAYEREIKTMFGLVPLGHPNPRSTVIHANWPKDVFPLRKDVAWDTRPSMIDDFSYPFFEVKGEGIYQIPVGPVHAGIIEPGHFVFSVLGEEIQQLDAQLGYVHKGVEKLFEQLPHESHLKLAEHVSGDSTVHHALAYAQAIEQIIEAQVPLRAQYLRTIFAELERVANHLNDIGFIMLDTAFSFGGAHGARLRERIMQWNEKLTGSRFMRGVICVGGVTRDISHEVIKELIDDLKVIERDFHEVIMIAEKSATLANRVDRTGILKAEIAQDYGVVGVPLRATGIARDARKDFAYAAYEKFDFSVATRHEGDVAARMWVRIYEVYSSLAIIREALHKLPSGAISTPTDGQLRPNKTGISVVEGWRGDIVYVVRTDDNGKISRVKVRDASFLNWQAFPHVVEGEMVPDFPLCNKSFNLSYTGNDL